MLNYKKSTDIDAKNKIPLDDRKFENSDVTVMIDMDFTEKIYEIYYFTITDVMGLIGGLNASIGPVFGFIAPLFVLNYLYQLSQLALCRHLDQYKKEIRALFFGYQSAFKNLDLNSYEILS